MSERGSNAPSRPEARPVPTEEQVAATYRQLADAYSLERARANRERTWQRIELKASLKKRSRLSPRARRGLRWGGWSLAAAAAALVVYFVAVPDPGRLEYAVEGGHVEQGWVVTAKQVARLDFSDGSELQLAEDSALSVDALGPHSALTRLARGRVTVEVEHHDDTRWTFLAGPYEVRVEGTAFDLSWRAEQLEVNMHEGRVRVVGPNRQEWVLHKGDDLVVPAPAVAEAEPVRVATREAEVPAEPGTRPATPSETEPAEEAVAGASPAPEHASPESVAASSRKSVGWTKLLKEGRFAELVAEARKGGVEQAMRTRPIAEVEALAHAARYTGDGALAEECWKGIRSRAPGSAAARQSAFFLGRVMEQQGRRSEAIQWFARYREEGSGVYAGQALGRQMVLTSGQGRASAAQELARTYLERYPNGPYAKAARGVLGEDPAGK